MLGEFSGGEGSIAYTDGGLDAGTYTYYVIPVHPQLEVAGERVVGQSSERILVSVPGGG